MKRLRPVAVRPVVVALLAALLLSAPLLPALSPMHAMAGSSSSEAGAYEDADSQPLKVVYYLVYPVGKLIELLVFKPIQFVGSWMTGEREEPDRDGSKAVGPRAMPSH
ncbi:MAG TPA: hypothetical protein EYG16_05230 [Deltaproteobacteria bacterium]|nr:hypothetical protein [Candidatus Binatota bacterium]HIL13058.1 hypothetical protein [Deltaproteobacteria bacterium]